MSDELHDERLADLFSRATDLSAEDQALFLENECRNDSPEIRQRLEKLLAADRQLNATADLLPPEPTASTQASRFIGPFKLLQRLGEGGMGEVWMAEQQHPVRRRVALKLIRSDSPTKEIIARFEAERQALAMMDHPNIAKVLDLGQTEGGQPYFVMDLVQGIPITDYCDRNKLTPSERLTLFVPVCQAIQHAHQKGIIHRDIKPSNVLITLYDGKPVAKVIDFGLAKALQTQTRLTDKTLFTEFGRVVGTLRYMSPEQAEMNALDVDTRTDVYSLGVMMYELLTGSTPLDQDTIKQKALFTVLQMIRDQEPPRPSKRLSDSGEAISGISAQRRIEPAQLSRILKGDLDWVVMKALEKDRTRRYATAASLADDVRRYLDNEPVQARPPSFRYRFGKLARKHRAAALAATMVLGSLLVGIITTSGIATWALSERTRADSAASAAIAEKVRADEKSAEALAEKNRSETLLGRSERLLYANQIASAYRDWKANDVDGAWRNLEACRWDLRGWEHDYLYTLFNNQTTFKGNAGPITSVAFSPDGKRIISGHNNAETLKVWNAESGQEMLALAHTDAVTSVAFSPDGKRIVSGSGDSTLKVWDATSGQEMRTLQGHMGPIWSVAFSQDGKRIVSGSDDNTLKVWDTSSGQELLTLKGHTDVIRNVAFSQDGKRMVSGSNDNTVKVWDTASGQSLLTLQGHWNWVADFSPDRKRIVSGGNDHTLKVWDATSGREMLTLQGHSQAITSVAFSRDGKRIVSGSNDNTVKIWNATSGQEMFTLKGHSRVVTGVAFSPDGKHIVSGSIDKTLKVWDAISGQELLTLQGHSRAVLSVAFSPDGKRIASGGDDDAVIIWDAASGQEMLTLKGHSAAVSSVTFSPDGKRIVSGGYDGTTRIWDAANGQELLTLQGEKRRVQSGQVRITLEGGTRAVLCVAFSPDGKQIACGSFDSTLRVWDASSRQEESALQEQP